MLTVATSYSLLLGIDDTNQRLSFGIIDYLSVYDLAKFFESKGKLILKSSSKKEVTVSLGYCGERLC